MRWLLVLAVTLCACPSSQRMDTDVVGDVAETAGNDIARLKLAVEDIAGAAGDLTEEGARETAEGCEDTVGDCDLCWELDGGYLNGTYTAETTPAACGVDWSIRGALATYTVDTSSLSGGWTASSLAGDYTLTMSGSRSASLVTTTRDGTATRDASWTLSSLEATTVDFEVTSVAATLTYTGFGDHVWTLALSGDAAGPTGSLTVDDGSASCTVGGTWESPTLGCM